jgi:SOS-response transcriptional repressor LexA
MSKKRHKSPYTVAVLRCIERYVKAHGYAPTLREIQDMLKEDGVGRAEAGVVSTSVINYQIKILVEAGKLRHAPGKARSISLVEGHIKNQSVRDREKVA